MAIACALAMRPTLLILDEAFSRLTAQASAMLLERLGHWALAQRSLIILLNAPLRLFCLVSAGMATARWSAFPAMLTLNQVTWRWPGATADCLQNISLALGQGMAGAHRR